MLASVGVKAWSGKEDTTLLSIEVCRSQEKPVILQGACPGRLLMNTYGNRNESDITILKSRCTCKAHNIIAAVGE